MCFAEGPFAPWFLEKPQTNTTQMPLPPIFHLEPFRARLGKALRWTQFWEVWEA